MLSIQKYKKYFPECYKHGTLDQIWSQAAYKWLCKHGSCKSEAFGLTHEMFIKMMSDSKKYEINETDREEIAKQLSYFPSILKSEISHILNTVFNSSIEFIESWKNTLAKIECEIKKIVESNKETIKRDARIRAEAETSILSTKRICRLCGFSTCKTINSCMDTSN